MDAIFSLSNLLVMPFWLLMIALPHWRWTRRLIGSPLIALGPAIIYLLLAAPRLVELLGSLTRPRLADIAALLGTPEGATLAWVHFLAFDLFVGRWIYLDSRERQTSAWLVGPVLFFTLMLGPIGFLLYLAVRTVHDRLSGRSLRQTVAQAMATNAPLTVTGLLMLAVLAATIVGLIVDPRVITGAPAWLKPAKFAISIAIYSFTLVWLLSFVKGHPRLVRAVGWVTAGCLLLEEVIIAGQAARGTTSHFNAATPFDAALFSVMGSAIVVVWLLALIVAVLLLLQDLGDPAFAWSLRLGVLISLVGMGVAVLMTGANPAQEQVSIARARAAGQPVTTIGAHAVGVEDGGPGLPIVGWSTEGGDLRVPHFVGLHALQVLPLAAWLLGRLAGARLRTGHRVALVWTIGLAYLGLVLLLTWQALRGQSIVAPDPLTLSAFAGLITASALASLLVLARARLPIRAALAPL